MRPRVVAVLFSAAMLVAATPAHATFPGANGKIAFIDTGSPCCASAIFTMNPDETGLAQVPNTAGASSPVWSPDGTRIAFESLGGSGDYEIYVVNADGTGLTQLTNNTVNDNEPTWSPDGTKIAFIRRSDPSTWLIYGMNSTGSGQALIANPGTFPGGSTNYAANPDWSPSGDRIAYDNLQIFVIAADGSSGAAVTNACCDLLPTKPSWSPDSARIAFEQEHYMSDVETPKHIEVMNADGSSRQVITPLDEFYRTDPVWSPDGTRIIYTDEQCSSCLVFIDPDGTDQSPTSVIGFDADWQALPRASYAHPQSAATLSTALVPVSKQCGTGGNPANANHAPPLAVGSCSPPQPSSAVVHLGAQMQGSAAMTVTPGDSNPTNGDQANIALTTSLSDVQTSAGADYNPNASGADVTQVTRLRLTDQSNGYGGVSATAGDFDFQVPINCAPTAAPSVGSTCAVNTTADTVLGGFAQEQRRTVIQAFRVRVYDSGLNGVRQSGTGDDKIFAHEGLFVP